MSRRSLAVDCVLMIKNNKQKIMMPVIMVPGGFLQNNDKLTRAY